MLEDLDARAARLALPIPLSLPTRSRLLRPTAPPSPPECGRREASSGRPAGRRPRGGGSPQATPRAAAAGSPAHGCRFGRCRLLRLPAPSSSVRAGTPPDAAESDPPPRGEGAGAASGSDEDECSRPERRRVGDAAPAPAADGAADRAAEGAAAALDGTPGPAAGAGAGAGASTALEAAAAGAASTASSCSLLAGTGGRL
mmetsp:Transcript_4404/g.13945  ORF Transcript_4404/g.13945 Transcript_4404/m.13945 type:complete len:200 (-) Transcript_4404:16-615(-)